MESGWVSRLALSLTEAPNECPSKHWQCPGRYTTPLIADIHFSPTIAMLVAQAFEKIRINPGNFVDGRKTFEEINYDKPGEFEAERDHIREVGPHLSSREQRPP